MSDSNINVILYSEVTSDGHPSNITETVDKVLCSKTNPCVDSSHDAIISTFTLPPKPVPEVSSDNIVAPRVLHTKFKVLWSEEGIRDYQNLLSTALPSLQSDYWDVSVPEAASVLFKVTNHILNEAAKITNKCIESGLYLIGW